MSHNPCLLFPSFLIQELSHQIKIREEGQIILSLLLIPGILENYFISFREREVKNVSGEESSIDWIWIWLITSQVIEVGGALTWGVAHGGVHVHGGDRQTQAVHPVRRGLQVTHRGWHLPTPTPKRREGQDASYLGQLTLPPEIKPTFSKTRPFSSPFFYSAHEVK